MGESRAEISMKESVEGTNRADTGMREAYPTGGLSGSMRTHQQSTMLLFT